MMWKHHFFLFFTNAYMFVVCNILDVINHFFYSWYATMFVKCVLASRIILVKALLSLRPCSVWRGLKGIGGV